MNKELIELITNNPDLPIFAWVDSDVVCDDSCGKWLGRFGSAEIKEYAKVKAYGYNEQTMVFKDEIDEYFNCLIEEKYFEIEPDEKAIELANKEIGKLKYKKAIFVNVDLPDGL